MRGSSSLDSDHACQPGSAQCGRGRLAEPRSCQPEQYRDTDSDDHRMITQADQLSTTDDDHHDASDHPQADAQADDDHDMIMMMLSDSLRAPPTVTGGDRDRDPGRAVT
eukprot:752465-Rhodomonas_salina.1